MLHHEPWHFFWATGFAVGFLDNAPTYVVFFELGEDAAHCPKARPSSAPRHGGELGAISVPRCSSAISLGAVFMGAMTYIGNGPNFMVKAIAEQSGVRMPSFFGYMFKYSIPILVPVFVLIMIIFLW